MKRASKKLLSLLLALCMLAGMIPMYAVTTSAADTIYITSADWNTIKSQIEGASAGSTVILNNALDSGNGNRIDFQNTITIKKM